MNQLRLLLRAMRWRAGAAAALLIVATVAVLAATAGPLYLDTANDSVLHSTLLANPVASTGITIIPSPTANGGSLVSRAQEALLEARRIGLYRFYYPGKMVLDQGFGVVGAGGIRYGGSLVADPGQCGVLHFLAGHCPGVGEVAITERTATALGAHLGTVVTLPGSPTISVKVVGLVALGNPKQSFWFGEEPNYFDFGPALACGIGASCLPQLDSFFTAGATISRLSSVQPVDEFVLRIDSVHTTDAAAFNRVFGRFSTYTNQALLAPVSTDLGKETTAAGRQSELMQSIVLVVDLQLVLLALFVLFGLVARTAEAREKEVALAKLRGFRTRSLLLVGLLEPVAVLCVALPLGIVLALLAMRVAQPLVLPGAIITIQPIVLVAAVAAFAGGLVATVFGARRILTRRLADELRAVEPRASSTARAALDAAALALALAGIVELLAAGVLSGSQPNPVAAFAPGLVAVAVAVVGVRVLPLLCAVIVRRTRNSRWLATGLAVRQVVRRPTSLRQVTVLAIATGLACFAVTGWAAAGINRTVRADFVLGAARVLTVQVPNSVNIEHAVDTADPSGRYAMAVMLSSIPSQNLLAVQVSRLRQVAYWPKNISATSESRIVKWLTPHLQPAMYLTGSEVRATITMQGNPTPPPDLVFNLVNSGGHQGVADFGFLSPGTHTYTTALPATCSGGCHVLSLEPLWNQSQTGPQQVSYLLTIASLDERGAPGSPWKAATPRLADPGYWSPSAPGIQTSATSGGGVAALVLRVKDNVNDSSLPGVVPGAMPQTIPGVMTQANSVSDPADTTVEDFDGSSLNLNVPFRVAALPQLGYQGFLVDLQTAIRGENAPPSQTETQVWLARGAPSSIERSLRAQGIRITAVRTPGPDIARMNHGGLALAYLFFLFAAGAAAVLAIGAAVFSVFMTSRRRAFELAVLRAIGVPSRTLMRSLLGEQLLVLGPGVLLGIGAGLLGALMALPSVPEFASSVGAPPVELVFAVVPIVAMVVVLVVLLAVAASLASLATLRLATWDRLRTEIT
ncbi:MAG: FtsX-like permease family protein [Candidatus Dormibacteria bacterium]